MCKVAILILHGVRIRLKPGEEEQLLDEVRGAFHAFQDIAQGMFKFHGITCVQGYLCLGLQACQWCTQFVGCIGRESAFVFQHPVQAVEQPVQGIDEGSYLQRCVIQGDGLQLR